MTQSAPKPAKAPKSLSEERVITAARKLFMERGFSAVSGDLLCREARVSKTSLYKYFGDMNGVLQAVLVEEGDLYQLDINTEPENEAAFWDTLIGYGTNLLKLLNEPFCLNMDRTFHEEARANPELVRLFYDNAYGRGHRDIAALLEHGKAQNFFHTDLPATDLADNLISMWEGLRYIRARLGLTDKPFEDPEKWAAQCVGTLLRRR
ncbi:MAG: TetR/AcrR family transcriptional regulator [Pseudomonadota bacterium]